MWRRALLSLALLAGTARSVCAAPLTGPVQSPVNVYPQPPAPVPQPTSTPALQPSPLGAPPPPRGADPRFPRLAARRQPFPTVDVERPRMLSPANADLESREFEQQLPGEALGEAADELVEDSAQRAWGGPKPGFFQRLSAQQTWISGGGSHGWQMHETTLSLTGGVPFFRRDAPLLFTPGFVARFNGGPEFVDVPAQLYDATFEIRHLRKLNDRWGIDLAIAPGVYSDFQQGDADMFRLTGRAFAAWQWRPKTQIIAGVAYFNRQNLKIMPVGGLIYRPSDAWSIEATPPRPRVARRVAYDGRSDAWLYLAGEFGGGAWSVERVSGETDLLTLNDFRVRLGVERSVFGGFKSFAEVGYVFGRSLTYRSVDATLDLDDAVLLRAGLAY